MQKKIFLLGSCIICFILGILLSSIFAYAASSKFVEFLVDSSGSMGEILEGRAKMDIAKEAISSVLNEIPDDIPLGLRVYGHKYSEKEKSCQDTELLVPINTGTKTQIKEEIYTLEPNGYTPIAYSLTRAIEDFPLRDAYCYIVLVSDGKETCGGEPVSTVKELRQKGYKIIVHTIGFDVDEETRKQLKEIAAASDGLYMDASNTSELGKSLKTITEKIREFQPYKEESSVEPGSGFSSASLVGSNQVYGYDILVGEEHFYKVPVKKGDSVTITATMKRKEEGDAWSNPLPIYCRSNASYPGSEDPLYGDPSAFVYSVNFYDPDRFILQSTTDTNQRAYTLYYNTVEVQSTRLQGEVPFDGEAYLSFGLKWLYPTMPPKGPSCFLAGYVATEYEKQIEGFSLIRNKVRPNAYYTFKIRVETKK